MICALSLTNGPTPRATPGRAELRRTISLAFVFAWLYLLLSAGVTAAQHDGAANSAPPPPAGDGTLRVQVKHKEASARSGGLDVALYALDPSGQPGFASGQTDSEGRSAFEGISNDPAIIYLVGVRYREIPFGERITFAQDATTATVQIEISDPTDQVGDVAVEELRTRIDWMGDRIVVREILKLRNGGNEVVLLPVDDPARAITRRPLDPEASDFTAGPTSIGDGVGLANGAVRFWGPLYPGEQSIEYQYSLPTATLDSRLTVTMREAIERVVIVAGTRGLGISGEGLIASSDVSGDRGQRLSAWARSGLAAGTPLEVALALPETRKDASLIEAPRTDIWLEIDDAQLTARVDLSLRVEPGTPVAGSPSDPLFHVSIPSGATLNGVAPETEGLGLVPTEDGGFDVVGPIGPGESSLSYSYRMPAGAEGASLDLRFPREVSTLNVLIADTEVKVESTRLHRRRPFRSGTRNYLHREAYNVSETEVVDITLTPIVKTVIPRNVTMALTIVAAAAGIFFLVAPLRRTSRTPLTDEDKATPTRLERENVYVAIQDLDHDFETGKLEREDHETMRAGLRARAIELLREERNLAATQTQHQSAAPPQPAVAGTDAGDGPEARGTTASTTRFCPHCGQAIDPHWKFCSHCGGDLRPNPAPPPSGKISG